MRFSPEKIYPVYCSSSFIWKDGMGVAEASNLIKVGSERLLKDYPGVFIQSAKTGVTKYFEPVHNEDGYDGEFMVYSSENIVVHIWNY